MTEKKDEVVEKAAGADVDPTPTPTPEEVPSPEVKVEAPVAEKVVDVTKLESQVENLNTALRQEREANKLAAKEWEEKIGQSQETIDKLKNVFSPEAPEDPEVEGVTMDQIESLLDSRDEERKAEQKRAEQQKVIKSEVSKLEDTWDGSEGKPKYEDKQVLEWQEQNSKLHLSPSEAFNEMNRDAIIDWEIKNRMSQKPKVQNVETPGGIPSTREPEETIPKTSKDLRNAVLEAMEITSDENIK